MLNKTAIMLKPAEVTGNCTLGQCVPFSYWSVKSFFSIKRMQGSFNSADSELSLTSTTHQLRHLSGLEADPLNFLDSDGNGTAVPWWLWGLKEIIHIKHVAGCLAHSKHSINGSCYFLSYPTENGCSKKIIVIVTAALLIKFKILK